MGVLQFGGVLATILNACEEVTLTPVLSPSKGEG